MTSFDLLPEEVDALLSSVRKFNPDQERDDRGRFGEGHGETAAQFKPSEKMLRAMAAYVPAKADKQRLADEQERKLSSAIGLERTKDNSAFDLNNGKIAVELKTMIDSKNGKITMSKAALSRKNEEIARTRVKAYTVVADKRAGQTAYYYTKGVGSFRVSSMTPTTLSELKGILHGR